MKSPELLRCGSLLPSLVPQVIASSLRATPPAAGPFQLLAVAIWGTRRLYFGTLGDLLDIVGAPRGPWDSLDGCLAQDFH